MRGEDSEEGFGRCEKGCVAAWIGFAWVYEGGCGLIFLTWFLAYLVLVFGPWVLVGFCLDTHMDTSDLQRFVPPMPHP